MEATTNPLNTTMTIHKLGDKPIDIFALGAEMTVTELDTTTKDGKVVSIAGPVIDAEFPEDSLPEINSKLSFDLIVDGETITVLAEVAQQIGDSRVRAISLKLHGWVTTRGTAAENTGSGIQVLVYKTLGHVWNVIEPLDVELDSLDIEMRDGDSPSSSFI